MHSPAPDPASRLLYDCNILNNSRVVRVVLKEPLHLLQLPHHWKVVFMQTASVAVASTLLHTYELSFASHVLAPPSIWLLRLYTFQAALQPRYHPFRF